NVALRIATSFPRVVDIHVDVACFFHAVSSHCIGNSADGRVIDTSGKLVPTVPTHWRCPGKTIVWHFVKCPRRTASRESALTGGHSMGHEFWRRGIRSTTRCHVQFVSDEFALVAHLSFGWPILHAARESETIRSAGAFCYLIIKLRDPNRTCDARTFLFEI